MLQGYFTYIADVSFRTMKYKNIPSANRQLVVIFIDPLLGDSACPEEGERAIPTTRSRLSANLVQDKATRHAQDVFVWQKIVLLRHLCGKKRE